MAKPYINGIQTNPRVGKRTREPYSFVVLILSRHLSLFGHDIIIVSSVHWISLWRPDVSGTSAL
jgi:hypothetical protein